MKYRLDKLLVSKGLTKTRQQAQELISSGRISVNGLPADKASSMFAADCTVELQGDKCPYVSRGGIKLVHGLDFFSINPKGYICADIGASTGGFTDCLLQRGAQKVYAVDVGYGQLAWKLRNNSKVIVMERINARYLKKGDFPDPLNLAVIDAAFISLKLIIPPLLPLFENQISIVALIKPQFEVGKGKVGKGGVVRDSLLHQKVIEDIINFGQNLGLINRGVTPSPILGPKGNKEFLIYFSSTGF